ncbi:MAG TPA: hypothetical protein VGD05_07245 [Pyrinomonadaceae bacterium]
MFKENQELYKKMCNPYENTEKAQEAIEKFASAVSKLRKKHRIAEVVQITQVYAMDGEYVSKIGATSTFGSELEAIQMTHRACTSLPMSLIKELTQKLKDKFDFQKTD